MRKLLLALALVCVPAAASAAVTSAQLEAAAVQIDDAKLPSSTLDKLALTLIREPAKTLQGIVLPTTAAQYTNNAVTAGKLFPISWRINVTELPIPQGCVGGLIHDSPSGPGWVDMEVWSKSQAGCAAGLTGAALRAWAWELRRVGR